MNETITARKKKVSRTEKHIREILAEIDAAGVCYYCGHETSKHMYMPIKTRKNQDGSVGKNWKTVAATWVACPTCAKEKITDQVICWKLKGVAIQ